MSGTTISVYRRQAISKWVSSSKGYTYSNKPADAQKPAITKGIWDCDNRSHYAKENKWCSEQTLVTSETYVSG